MHSSLEPALSRGEVDANASVRTDSAALAGLRASADARQVTLVEGRLLTVGGRLALTAVDATAALAYLGQAEGVQFFSNLEELSAPPAIGAAELRSLREIGAELSDLEAGLAVTAVALQNWHRSHTHCPRCGTPTQIDQAGWVRRCPADSSLHFPRTDPAVIVAVTNEQGRLLLARQVTWAEHQYSVLAGFCEPGESLEQAVRREVLEEVAVTVSSCEYQGSQPWPFPASLMLAFTAEGQGDIVVDGEEIAVAKWFSKPALAAACESGEVRLPPPVSIAHRLIEQWWGAPLPASWLRS